MIVTSHQRLRKLGPKIVIIFGFRSSARLEGRRISGIIRFPRCETKGSLRQLSFCVNEMSAMTLFVHEYMKFMALIMAIIKHTPASMPIPIPIRFDKFISSGRV